MIESIRTLTSRHIADDSFARYTNSDRWTESFATTSSHRHLPQSLSNDDYSLRTSSTVDSLTTTKYSKKRQKNGPSFDESIGGTVDTNQSNDEEDSPGFQMWLDLTSKFTDMVNCGSSSLASPLEAIKLNDEDFFWSAANHSFDTISSDARKRTSPFEKIRLKDEDFFFSAVHGSYDTVSVDTRKTSDFSKKSSGWNDESNQYQVNKGNLSLQRHYYGSRNSPVM